MRIGAHAVVARGCEGGDVGKKRAGAGEELVRAITPHPFLEDLHVLRVVGKTGQRYLVRTERPLDRYAIHLLGAGPALRRDEDDHRPPRPRSSAILTRVLATAPRVDDDVIEHRRHLLVQNRRIASFAQKRALTTGVCR